nr:putative ribonuclease H-like domain-containing protein [Tanacetum cinerariifolium]
VLVTKPHNKTLYELLLSRTPSIIFMRPFGYPVTILNTLDPQGRFAGKADEGFLVGYFVNSKAFRVFNNRTKIVQEIFHINFLENQPNVAGSRPKLLFDIDTLTQSMNYQPVVVGNQPNHNAGIQGNFNAGKVVKEVVSAQQYVLLPLWSTGSKDPHNIDDDAAFDVKANENEIHVSPSSSNQPKKHDEKAKKSPIDLSTGVRDLRDEFEEFFVNSTNRVNATSVPVTTIGPNPTNNTNSFNAASPSDNTVSLNFKISGKSLFVDPSQYPDDPDMPALKDILYSDEEEDINAEADFSNLETNISIKSTARMVKEQGGLNQINDKDFHTSYASFMGFMVYQMDVKSAFLYGTIKEEAYVYQPSGFEDPDYPDKVYKVVKALYRLHQAPRAWYETLANYLLKNGFQRGKLDQTLFMEKQKGDILLVQVYVDDLIFGSTNKELCKAFEKLMKDNQDKYVAEILRKFSLTDSKLASTPIDIEKPLLKDPDDSPFNLVAYSDSDYAGASLDRKSTTRGCQFLGCRLISWQCKKQTVVTTSSTEAEYVAVASCCAQVLWIQNQLLDYGHFTAVSYTLMMFGLTKDVFHLMLLVSVKKTNDVVKLQDLINKKKVVVTEDTIRQDLRLNDADGVECLPNEEIFAEIARMGYEKLPPKLTFYKAFFSAQ